MYIGNITMTKQEARQKISADIGPYSLWFKVSDDLTLQENDVTPFLT